MVLVGKGMASSRELTWDQFVSDYGNHGGSRGLHISKAEATPTTTTTWQIQ